METIDSVEMAATEARLKNKKRRQMYRIPILVGIIAFLIEAPIFVFSGNILNIWPYFIQETFNSLKFHSGVAEFIYWFRPPFDVIGLILLSMIIIHGAWDTRSKRTGRGLGDSMVFTYMPSVFYIFALAAFETWSRTSIDFFLWVGLFIFFLVTIVCLAPTKGLLWTIILSHAILLAIGTIIAGFLPALCWVLPLIITQHLVRGIKSIKSQRIWRYLSGEDE